MANIFFGNKKVSYKKRGDKLLVKLRDSRWETIFEKEVSINDKKGLKELILTLRNYGVDLRTAIKESSKDSWFD